MLLTCSLALADTFKMGIDPEYPPFSYLDDNGEYAGFDVEMCKAVCDMYGWEMQIVPGNWSFGTIRSRGTGTGICSRNPSRSCWNWVAARETIRSPWRVGTPK